MSEPQALRPGDPAPWFVASATSNPRYNFDTAAGRFILLCFFGSAAMPAMRAMLDALWQRGDLFQDDHAAFFGVCCDPDDQRLGRVGEKLPGFRVFWDFGLKISKAYGACDAAASVGGKVDYRPMSVLLDPNLRVLAVLPIADPAAHAAKLAEIAGRLPALGTWRPAAPGAPVLLVPYVLDRGLCREVIAHYERQGGEDSGFMTTDPAGRTVGVIDHGRKRRRDCLIEEPGLRGRLREAFLRRLVPEVRKVFQFSVTHIERYIVACYDAGEGGYFRPHRDNTTKGTAHRRFAVTLNLNGEDYDGGDLCFPEYGRQTYRAPTGAAIVFSCSLLHEATPVTRGRRYCVLPFLYDAAAARVRQDNLQYLADEKLRDSLQDLGAAAAGDDR